MNILLLRKQKRGAGSRSKTADLSREAQWPPISAYGDMAAWELSIEISFINKDLAVFEQSKDPKKRALLVEARNRLNLLFILFSEKTGHSLESVRKMYGY